jgi:hypothetical protein
MRHTIPGLVSPLAAKRQPGPLPGRLPRSQGPTATQTLPPQGDDGATLVELVVSPGAAVSHAAAAVDDPFSDTSDALGEHADQVVREVLAVGVEQQGLEPVDSPTQVAEPAASSSASSSTEAGGDLPEAMWDDLDTWDARQRWPSLATELSAAEVERLAVGSWPPLPFVTREAPSA